MFIRKKIKKNKNSEETYYQIVKNIKTHKGHRQKVVMHLGTLDRIIEVYKEYKERKDAD